MARVISHKPHVLSINFGRFTYLFYILEVSFGFLMMNVMCCTVAATTFVE